MGFDQRIVLGPVEALLYMAVAMAAAVVLVVIVEIVTDTRA